METQVIIPSPVGSDEYVELAGPRPKTAQGKVFKKHLLNLGTLIHPKTGEKLVLDEPWFDRLRDNFNSGVCDIVQVPLADSQNQHSEDPSRNLGEVIDVVREGSKVYSLVDIRDPDAVPKMGKTYLGASAMLNLDYTDTRTGKKVGPTLLHHCVTNRPYVTGLDPYEEVIAATADGVEDVIVLTPEDAEMPATKDELLAALKEHHGIDVAALEAAAAAKADPAALTAQLTAALQGSTASLTAGANGEITFSDAVNAIVELAQDNKNLGAAVLQLTRKDAEREIDGYVQNGRVLPKQRDAFIRLAMTDRDQMEVLLPDEPVVKLNHQVGNEGEPHGEGKQITDIDAEVVRLAAKHGRFFEGGAQAGQRSVGGRKVVAGV
jgi:hypothetical protein